VTLFGFGSFSCKHHNARQGRNPANGETIDIAASNTPIFKPAKVFKGKVN
jgi:DNA-binding protein HU-beta